MKRGWAIAGVGIVVMIAGITLFGRYVLATENWPAIVTTFLGMFLLALGFRSARGVGVSRSTLVATGTFLLLLSVYALFRVNWRISTAPQSLLLAASGVALVFIGSRHVRTGTVEPTTI